MGPEAKLLYDIVRRLKALKAKGYPIWWVKIHGSALMPAGTPDLYVLYGGRSFWIELKSPGKKPTPIQFHTIHQIDLAGGRAAWTDSLEGFCEIVGLTCSG